MGKPTWSGQDFSKKPAKVASVKKIAPGIKDCGSPFHNGQITDSVTQVRRYADGSPGGVKADEPGFFASVRDFFTKERPTSGSVSDEVYASKSYQDDKAAGLKASEGEKVGFFERLRMGNIDDPNSEAYRRFGAGRAFEDRNEKSRRDEYEALNLMRKRSLRKRPLRKRLPLPQKLMQRSGRSFTTQMVRLKTLSTKTLSSATWMAR